MAGSVRYGEEFAISGKSAGEAIDEGFRCDLKKL